jgi:hypothetical protein
MIMCPAPKGNQYAKGCETNGKPLAFKTPEEWRKAIDRYFDWCDANAINKVDVVKSGMDAGKPLYIPTVRPYLIEGLCDFLGISMQTFYNYEKAKGYEDYFEISAYARNRVFTQNLTYGYTGAFDSGLVARKLGLADKQELKGMLSLNPLSPDEIKQAKSKLEDEL